MWVTSRKVRDVETGRQARDVGCWETGKGCGEMWGTRRKVRDVGTVNLCMHAGYDGLTPITICSV